MSLLSDQKWCKEKKCVIVFAETILIFKFSTSLTKCNLNNYININAKQTRILNSWMFYIYDISKLTQSSNMVKQRPFLFISENKVYILILLRTSFEILGKSQISLSLFPGL